MRKPPVLTVMAKLIEVQADIACVKTELENTESILFEIGKNLGHMDRLISVWKI